jgi:hypothetical protein
MDKIEISDRGEAKPQIRNRIIVEIVVSEEITPG